MWQVLSWFSRNGYSWQPVTASESAAAACSAPESNRLSAWKADVARAAEAEYERWAQARWENGWWATKNADKDDYHRVHPDLRGWKHVDRAYNEALVEEIVLRMWATGLVPVPVAQHSAEPSDRAQTRS